MSGIAGLHCAPIFDSVTIKLTIGWMAVGTEQSRGRIIAQNKLYAILIALIAC